MGDKPVVYQLLGLGQELGGCIRTIIKPNAVDDSSVSTPHCSFIKDTSEQLALLNDDLPVLQEKGVQVAVSVINLRLFLEVQLRQDQWNHLLPGPKLLGLKDGWNRDLPVPVFYPHQ